ncbi:MAG: hypothetical protein M3Z08_07485 [Chloroflexota bacterium]|nr:hypothetical protein [Chloroflexota bacterium]
MDGHSEIKDIKSIDPIWRRLRFDRIWKLLSLAFMLIYVIFFVRTLWQIEGSFAIFLIFFLLFGVVINAITQFRGERYWKRIGQRRLEALRDPQPFVSGNQIWPTANALPLPATIRLRWNRIVLGAVVALVIIGFGLMLVGIFLASLHANARPAVLLISGIFIFVIVLLALLTYFLFMRYQTQEITLTEEGISTRYMGQERRLCWEEARIFAVYDAQGIKKSVFAQTYELSNAQTVVRWGQQRLANPFFVVQSSVNKREDFNWQVGQINALVAARTGLPLLDLSDRSQARRPALQTGGISTPVREQPEEVRPLAPVPIIQNDPLLRRLQVRGEVAVSFGVLVALAVIAIIVGLIGKLSHNTGSIFSLFSGGSSNFFLVVGAILLACMFLLLGIMQLTQHYWQRIGHLRSEALQQPERFRARVQPTPALELPQPASIRIRTRRSVMLPLLFIEYFVLFFLFFALLFGLEGNHLIIALVVCVLASLVMSVYFRSSTQKAQERRIEVTPAGISSRFGGVDTQIHWQDVRLFAVYRGMQLFKRASRTQVYELASTQTAVRLQWSHSRFQTFATEPEMSQQTFDAWMEHLNGYFVAQTHLSLVELDTAERQP